MAVVSDTSSASSGPQTELVIREAPTVLLKRFLGVERGRPPQFVVGVFTGQFSKPWKTGAACLAACFDRTESFERALLDGRVQIAGL